MLEASAGLVTIGLAVDTVRIDRIGRAKIELIAAGVATAAVNALPPGFRRFAHGAPVQLEAQSWPVEDGQPAAPQRQVGLLNDVPRQKIVHVLVAIVQVGSHRRRMGRRHRGNSRLVQSVDANVDVGRLCDVRHLAEA